MFPLHLALQQKPISRWKVMTIIIGTNFQFSSYKSFTLGCRRVNNWCKDCLTFTESKMKERGWKVLDDKRSIDGKTLRPWDVPASIIHVPPFHEEFSQTWSYFRTCSSGPSGCDCRRWNFEQRLRGCCFSLHPVSSTGNYTYLTIHPSACFLLY